MVVGLGIPPLPFSSSPVVSSVVSSVLSPAAKSVTCSGPVTPSEIEQSVSSMEVARFSGAKVVRVGHALADPTQVAPKSDGASQVGGFAASSSGHNQMVPVVLEVKGSTVVQAKMESSERVDGFNVSTDGASPVRPAGSGVGSTIHEEVGSRGHSDGSN